MRVSALGWAFNTDKDILSEAEASATVTHNHPEGLKGAQAVALSIFRARSRVGKDAIRTEIIGRFGYDLSAALDEIRPSYCFDETSPGTVPQAITAFLESDDYEDAIQKAISLGGDADTLAAITESIAEASYGGVPPNFIGQVRKLVPVELWNLIEEFRQKYLLLGIHPPE